MGSTLRMGSDFQHYESGTDRKELEETFLRYASKKTLPEKHTVNSGEMKYLRSCALLDTWVGYIAAAMRLEE